MPPRRKTTVVIQAKKKTKKKAKPVTQREIGLLGQALRALGTSAGGAIGGVFGAPTIGATAGHGLGASISRWLGAGDYTVSQNSLVNSVKASGSIPMMHQNDQSIIVRHKEFVCEVVASTSFTVRRSFTINPGNSELFPWLSTLADSYQQYRIRGMVFHYVPSSGSIAASSPSLGTVMMQTSYRANDAPPANKVEMLNEYWSSEAMPSETFVHPIECNPNENPFNVQYIRSNNAVIPAQDSPLLYDLGVAHLAVSGQANTTSVLGDLWISYEVELKKPVVNSNVTSSDLLFAQLQNTSATLTNLFGGLSPSVGNLVFSSTTTNSIILPKSAYGKYWILIRFAATAVFSDPVWTNAVGVTPLSSGFGGIFSPWTMTYGTSTPAGSSVLVMHYGCFVTKINRENTLTITPPTPTTTGGSTGTVEVSVWGSDVL